MFADYVFDWCKKCVTLTDVNVYLATILIWAFFSFSNLITPVISWSHYLVTLCGYRVFSGYTDHLVTMCVVTRCSLVTLTIWLQYLCAYRVFSGYTDHLFTMCVYRVFSGYTVVTWLQGVLWLHWPSGYNVCVVTGCSLVTLNNCTVCVVQGVPWLHWLSGYTVCVVTGCSLLTSRIVSRSPLLPTGAKRWSLPISWQSSAMVEVSFYSLSVQKAMPLNKSKVTLEFSHATVNFLSLPVWKALPSKKLKVTL